MFDTMTVTKITASLCGALLVLLLGSWAADEIYHVGGGHGYGEVRQAYVIDTGEDDAPAEVAEEVDFALLLAAADLSAGERSYARCRACHMLNSTNGTGPYLNGVVGRQVASVAGFNYSDALSASADVWDADALNAFLLSPRNFAPGNRMSFAGMPNIQERANLIAWLETLQ